MTRTAKDRGRHTNCPEGRQCDWCGPWNPYASFTRAAGPTWTFSCLDADEEILGIAADEPYGFHALALAQTVEIGRRGVELVERLMKGKVKT